MDLNTYMINPSMCADPSQKKRQSSGSGSPKASVAAQQRKRILSPRRQKFESHFERYITRKLVDDKLVDPAAPEMDFDTTTKPEGTLNTKVNKKLQWLAEEKKKQKMQQVGKSLSHLEKDAQELLSQEVVVVMGPEFQAKLKEVFDSCKERGKEHIDEVEVNELVPSIAEEPYFDERMNQDVRESLDGVRENLYNLLTRINKAWKQETITWHAFIGFFTRRGRLRDNEQARMQAKRGPDDLGGDDVSMMSFRTDESYESKHYRLKRDLNKALARKQDLVPKSGKGKYDVTVPRPFEFMNAEKAYTIRQQKFEQMMA